LQRHWNSYVLAGGVPMQRRGLQPDTAVKAKEGCGMAILRVDVVGIPWYTRERYPQILEIMDDAAALPVSYDDWLTDATDTADELRRQGVAVVPADIDPKTFLSWCERQHHHPDALARRTFASALALASVYPYAGRA
jgi:hypothetical protein